MVLQTFRTSIGELGMPNYPMLLNIQYDSEGEPISEEIKDWWSGMNVFLIWMMWYIQTFFMLVVMLNFIIAVITSTYSKVINFQKFIGYQHKAELNLECHELLELMRMLKPYKLLTFSNSKDVSVLEEDMLQEVINSLKKFIGKENKELKSQHKEISTRLGQLTEKQTQIENEVKKQFSELFAKQEDMQKLQEAIRQDGGHFHVDNSPYPLPSRRDK